jgi:hypothetical protein
VLSKQNADTRERLEYLAEGRESDGVEDEYAKELTAIEQATDLKSLKVDQYIKELTDLKLRTSVVTQGFVDFPAMRENEAVCLCWHLADKEVMYWHRQDEDCSARRLVDLPLIRQSGDRHFSSSV